MAPCQSRYDVYKEDTKKIVYWVTHTYDKITKSTHTHNPSVREISRRVEAIAKHKAENTDRITRAGIPPACVFEYFLFVIEARTKFWQFHKVANLNSPDPEVEESNNRHEFFIKSLQAAFDLLGGQDWLSSPGGPGQRGQRQDAGDRMGDESEESARNMFSKLCSDEQDAESTGRSPSPPSGSPTTQNHETDREDEHESSGSKLEDVSTEGYCIDEEDDEIDLEYQMAAMGLFEECHEIRYFFASVWTTVAANHYNIAIAGAISIVAIATLKRSEKAILRGPDVSYEAFLKVIAPGTDPRQKTKPKMVQCPIPNHYPPAQREADWNEIFFVYTYQNFIDFVRDFKKNNDGSPSNTFKKERENWDPNLDLRNTKRKKCRAWRRTYTIAWLYDLVNVFSSLCEENNPSDGSKWDPRKADWSFVGGRDGSRHLCGLEEFARFACSLAWVTNVKECSICIKPHHVLQLQIIIDSMSTSQRWFDRPLFFRDVAPDDDDRHSWHVRPGRVVVPLPHRYNMSALFDYLVASEELVSVLRSYTETSPKSKYSKIAHIIETHTDRFRKLLGDAKHESDPTRLQQRKRLWEHSPLLCGLVLMEALETAFGIGTLLWNQISEPVLAIHLHNMLVKTGYIKKPVDPYSTLQEKLGTVFFSKTTPPASGFARALRERITSIHTRHNKNLCYKVGLSKSTDILVTLDKGRAKGAFFPESLNTTLYRLANWDV